LRVVTVVFRPIDLYVITSTFFYVFYVFFKIQKNVTFYVFLPCFIRFLELWLRGWTISTLYIFYFHRIRSVFVWVLHYRFYWLIFTLELLFSFNCIVFTLRVHNVYVCTSLLPLMMKTTEQGSNGRHVLYIGRIILLSKVSEFWQHTLSTLAGPSGPSATPGRSGFSGRTSSVWARGSRCGPCVVVQMLCLSVAS